MPNLIDISTGKPFTRRSALKGLAAIIAAGVSPSVVSASTGGLRRGLGARLGMMGGGGWTNPYVTDGLLDIWDLEINQFNGDYWVGQNGSALIKTGDSSSSPIKQGNHLTFDGNCGLTFSFGSRILSYEVLSSGIGLDNQETSTPCAFSIKNMYSAAVFRCYKNNACLTRGITGVLGDNYTLANWNTKIGLMSFVSTDTTASWYTNGIFYKSINTTCMTGSKGIVCVAYQPETSLSYSGCKVNIYCIRCYNKILTSDEIATNYAVDKVRFGLP